MTKIRVNLFEGRPLLDIASYARRGPGQRDHLSPAEIAQISRAVKRVPEVVVKVLPKDSNNLASIGKHLGYIGRYGNLELESDDGDRLSGKGVGQDVIEKWDLDLQEHRRRSDLSAASGRSPPKLVHKLMFSMPPGTPPDKVLAAVRNFAREEFALQHRYVFVLHTNEDHPHVHLVLKAVSEQGVRLNIKKVTLRNWRLEFARNLRLLGVPANATERAVRGESRATKKDGIYRASLRGDSTYIRAQAEAVAAEVLNGKVRVEPGKRNLVETRRVVQGGWRVVANILAKDNREDLANDVRQFADQMPLLRTERETLAIELLSMAREQKVRDQRLTR